GHFAKYCKEGNAPRNPKPAYYNCGSTDHFWNTCPRPIQAPRNNPGNQGGPARGRAFIMGAEEARQDPNAVAGTFILNNHYASILFDSGVERSFVSLEFRPLIDLGSKILKENYVVEYASSHKFEAKDVITDCSLCLAGELFTIDLIPIQIKSFEFIIGMDWLAKVRADIMCFEKAIRISMFSIDKLSNTVL
ncbi:MAG: hypothetical protein Q8886_02785, partial [Candidatus Phytoplasma australasiaticum]|nr:hypothetical protein [Candidatus Phytoplasma australasiaticum]